MSMDMCIYTCSYADTSFHAEWETKRELEAEGE